MQAVRLTISLLAMLVALLLGACGAPGGPAPLDAEQSAAPIQPAAGSTAPSAERIVEPHRMPNGWLPVHGTATYRPTPDGSTFLSGTLIDDDGRPVVGAQVWTTQWPAIPSLQSSDVALGPVFQTSTGTTDDDGRFEIRSPLTYGGRLSLLARRSGHSELKLSPIEVVSGHELDIGIRVLRRAVPFEVEFVDAEGVPVEGIGLVQVTTDTSADVHVYAAWHGQSGSDGIVRTRSALGLDVMVPGTSWLAAVIPQQWSETLPMLDWVDSPGTRQRYVLPPRRWIEGRLIGAVPGRRFAVSTGGARTFLNCTWALRHYASDHPLRRNRTPVTPTTDTFRVPTWSGGGYPHSRPQIVLHIERSDGTWQPITRTNIDEEAKAATTDHDAAFPPIELRVPQLARIELSAGRYPGTGVRVTVRLSADTRVIGWAWLPCTDGELFVALEDIPDGTPRLEVTVSGVGFEDHRVSVAIGDVGPIVDLGQVDLPRKPPVNVLFVDDLTGAPVEGVVWHLWCVYQRDGFPLHLDGGESGMDGRTSMYAGVHGAYSDIVPPVGYELPDDHWDLLEGEPDATGTIVVRLGHLDQQAVRVVDVAGLPRTGLIVRDGPGGTPSVTDADGRAVVYGEADEDGIWHVVVESAARASGWHGAYALGGSWSFPPEGFPVREGPLATIAAPRHAPYWIQTWSDGVAVDCPISIDLSLISCGDGLGSVRFHLAPPGRQTIWILDAATDALREFHFDHPGPDRTVHIDLSAQ